VVSLYGVRVKRWSYAYPTGSNRRKVTGDVIVFTRRDKAEAYLKAANKAITAKEYFRAVPHSLMSLCPAGFKRVFGITPKAGVIYEIKTKVAKAIVV